MMMMMIIIIIFISFLQKVVHISGKELAVLHEGLIKEMEKTLNELRTMVEREKVAEEQERLRRIQVN